MCVGVFILLFVVPFHAADVLGSHPPPDRVCVCVCNTVLYTTARRSRTSHAKFHVGKKRTKKE